MLTQQNLSKVHGAPPQATYQCGVIIKTDHQWSFEAFKSNYIKTDIFVRGDSYYVRPHTWGAPNLVLPDILKSMITAENWRLVESDTRCRSREAHGSA
jgi:hypothetical protein